MNDIKFKITAYLKTQNWQRILAMLCVGVVVISLATYFNDSDKDDSSSTSKQSTTNKVVLAPPKNDMVATNSPANASTVALKDPFKTPESFKELPIIIAPTKTSGNPSIVNNNSSTNNIANSEIPKMKLTGIVGSGTTREAIVEINGKSRSYKKMDMVIGSPYQLIYMTSSAAVFRDSSDEKITLTIGR